MRIAVKKEDLWITVLLLAIPHLFLFGAVFEGKALFSGDLASFFYPFKQAAGEMYRSGHLYLWDPYIYSGVPTASEIQTALFYPLNFFYAILPAIKATVYFITFHLFLTSLFMFLYLREIKLSRISSLFGALVFTYSGYYLMHVDQLSMLGTGMWLPLILLFIEKAFKGKTLFYTILAGLAFGMQFLAGHPQVSVLMGFALMFYFGFKIYKPLFSKDKKEIKRILLIFVSFFLIGLALSAVALIPFIEASFLSQRGESDYEASSSIYVSPEELQTFLIPELRRKGSGLRVYGGTGEPYMGVVPFLLALFALFFVRGKYKIFYLILGAFSFLAALGKTFPLHYILFHTMPLYGMLQIPIRFLFLYSLSIAVLSALGLEYLGKNLKNIRKFGKYTFFAFIFLSLTFLASVLFSKVRNFLLNETEGGLRAPFVFLFYLGIFLLFVYLFQKKKSSYSTLTILISAMVLVDLLSFGSRYFTFSVVKQEEISPPIFSYLKKDQELYRVAISNVNFGPNLGMTHKIQSIGGYHPIVHKDYMRYVYYNDHHSLDFSQIPPQARVYFPSMKETNMTNLLNVRYLIFPTQKYGKYLTGISKIKGFLPRAFMVPQYSVLSYRNKILETLGDENFNPEEILLLDSDVGLEGYHFTPETAGSAEIVKYSEDRIDIRTKADGDAFLLLSEIFYSGWKVLVDGVGEKIYRANYMFRSVPLKAGEHLVSFVYDPLSFKVGVITTLVTSCLVFILSIVGIVKHFRKPI
ncbi:MAG: YfhO family protein [Candidatus Aminicenantes bacterium]|nr:YfhO family protein [Candidatus Aminicenantes bacterium]